MQANRILETCLCVDDLHAAEEFYGRVLGLKVYSRVEGRHVFFQCGAGMFLVFNPKQTAQAVGAMPTHGTLGQGHAAFAAEESELAAWRAQLLQEGIKIESEIQWPNGGRSIYFRDPAGNSVELATPRLWGL
jgi:catechol 2,3-dioxygenase-like lactoylglutathione lyase family enzyme